MYLSNSLMNTGTVECMSYRQSTRESRVAPAALDLFSRYNRVSGLRRLFRKSQPLQDLQTAVQGKNVRGRYAAGLQTISVDQIAGSEGRSADFDADFHPIESHTRYRWLRVATARDEGLGLPPVELIQLGDAYYVRDGHHRISVARARGEKAIEAQITVWELE